MTYTREQIGVRILTALTAELAEIRSAALTGPDARIAAIEHASHLANAILDQFPIPEPAPAPKENADEKRTTFEAFAGSPTGLCRNCGDVRSQHRLVGDFGLACPR